MAIGILLFAVVYGPIAYMVYAELRRHRPHVRTRPDYKLSLNTYETPRPVTFPR